jgi:hypothetical protein
MLPSNRADHKETEIGAQVDTALLLIRTILDIEKSQILTAEKISTCMSKLYRKPLPCEDPSLQFSRMPLHLIPMLIYTSEEVCTTMHIEHHPRPWVLGPLSLVVVGPHFNPFSTEFAPWPAPLPPSLASDFLDAMMPQLILYGLRGLGNILGRYFHLVNLHPAGMRHPLRRESLDFFNSVMRCIHQELADQVDTLIVGDMCRRLLS